MNSDKYIDVIESKVIPDKKTAFPDSGGILHFQHDLAPCFRLKERKTIFKKHKLNVLDGPGNSPDLKPIEKL